METAFVLVAAIIATCPGEPSEKAVQAYSKQSGLDEKLDAYQRQLLSEPQRQLVGNAALVTRVVIEQRVTYKWEF